jgi:hypothetical protein
MTFGKMAIEMELLNLSWGKLIIGQNENDPHAFCLTIY